MFVEKKNFTEYCTVKALSLPYRYRILHQRVGPQFFEKGTASRSERQRDIAPLYDPWSAMALALDAMSLYSQIDDVVKAALQPAPSSARYFSLSDRQNIEQRLMQLSRLEGKHADNAAIGAFKKTAVDVLHQLVLEAKDTLPWFSSLIDCIELLLTTPLYEGETVTVNESTGSLRSENEQLKSKLRQLQERPTVAVDAGAPPHMVAAELAAAQERIGDLEAKLEESDQRRREMETSASTLLMETQHANKQLEDRIAQLQDALQASTSDSNVAQKAGV